MVLTRIKEYAAAFQELREENSKLHKGGWVGGGGGIIQELREESGKLHKGGGGGASSRS